MPNRMLTVYQPVHTVIPAEPCHGCGFTKLSIMQVDQNGPIPIGTFTDLMAGLAKKNGIIQVLSENRYEIRTCLRCSQPPDEEPYEDDDAF